MHMPADETALGNGRNLPAPADPGTDLDRITAVTDRLITMVRGSEISRLALSVGAVRWEIESAGPATGTAPAHVAAPRADSPAEAAGPADPPGHAVVAPVVGVFYAAGQPGAAPFVEVGQQVEAGQQVAIIEAMKMMNEVTSDRPGVVREVHVEDGTVVEYGQRLFSLDLA